MRLNYVDADCVSILESSGPWLKLPVSCIRGQNKPSSKLRSSLRSNVLPSGRYVTSRPLEPATYSQQPNYLNCFYFFSFPNAPYIQRLSQTPHSPLDTLFHHTVIRLYPKFDKDLFNSTTRLQAWAQIGQSPISQKKLPVSTSYIC